MHFLKLLQGNKRGITCVLFQQSRLCRYIELSWFKQISVLKNKTKTVYITLKDLRHNPFPVNNFKKYKMSTSQKITTLEIWYKERLFLVIFPNFQNSFLD